MRRWRSYLSYEKMGEDRVNILRILTSTKWYQAVQIQKWYFHRLSLRYDTSNGWYSDMMQYFQRLRFWDDQSAEIRIYIYCMILPTAETQIRYFHRLRLRCDASIGRTQLWYLQWLRFKHDTSYGWDSDMIPRLRFFYKYSKETLKVFETIIDVSYGEQLWVIYVHEETAVYIGTLCGPFDKSMYNALTRGWIIFYAHTVPRGFVDNKC